MATKHTPGRKMAQIATELDSTPSFQERMKQRQNYQGGFGEGATAPSPMM